ncbi:hypothetical protein V865_006393 [Kwoniella europaea PYCC6329]|uniref:EH domain-containing protein n=1 Tax=Kwoniella europaea PYCC6329 TaxID=1423913 RepID=A0AAX4KPD3_9TREE
MSSSTPSGPTSNSTPSSSRSLPLPHAPFSAQSQSQSRFSYAMTSPPTPDPDRLFFRPPHASPDPDVTSSTPERQVNNTSMTNLVLGDNNGTGQSGGVAVGYGMDPKMLADMLSPPEPSSSSSSSSKRKKGKEKEKRVKNKTSNNSIKHRERERYNPSPPSTPPPVPPKNLLPPNTTPKSARTTTSLSSSLSLGYSDTTHSHSHSHSRHSHSTEIHSPKKAIHGRMTSASSHQLNPKPSLASLSGFSPSQPDFQPNYQIYYDQGEHESCQSISTNYPNPSESFEHETTLGHGREKLQASLAALPWAEPPPRLPSPNKLNSPTGGTGYSSSTVRAETPQRTPTYSFLANDPSVSASTLYNNHSRRPSATSSIKTHLTMSPIPEANSGPTLGVPQSPSVWSQSPSQSHDSYRSSQQSGYSGMAEFQPSSSSDPSGKDSQTSPISQDMSSPGLISLMSNTSSNTNQSGSVNHDRYPSIGSAMATKASSSTSHSNAKWSFVSRSKSSSTTKSSRSKSFKSVHSAKSYNSKRGSLSTLGGHGGRYVLKRWEVIQNFSNINSSNQHWEVLDGEEVRKKENQMDLRSLVGRAWVLERVLRSGKRVSSQSLKIIRPFTPSSSATSSPMPTRPPLPHLPASSISTTKHRPSLSVSVSVHPSRKSSLRHSHIPGNKHTPRSKSTSSSNTGTSRSKSHRDRRGSVPSIRLRLGKKLRRTESREDIFTEIGSSEEGGSRIHSRDNSVDSHDREERDYPSVPSPKRRSTSEKEKQKGEDRVGGKGVIVFPEELSPSSNDNIHNNEKKDSPPLPPKDHQYGKNRSGCTTPNCLNISPTSPTPLLPHPDPTYHTHTGSRHYDHPQANSNSNYLIPNSDTQGYDPEKGEGDVVLRYSPQSPHLGHRSPNWRNRQSVISYIETGVWEEKPKNRFKILIGVGAGMVVVLIVGLLVGLLVKRKEQSD